MLNPTNVIVTKAKTNSLNLTYKLKFSVIVNNMIENGSAKQYQTTKKQEESQEYAI